MRSATTYPEKHHGFSLGELGTEDTDIEELGVFELESYGVAVITVQGVVYQGDCRRSAAGPALLR